MPGIDRISLWLRPTGSHICNVRGQTGGGKSRQPAIAAPPRRRDHPAHLQTPRRASNVSLLSQVGGTTNAVAIQGDVCLPGDRAAPGGGGHEQPQHTAVVGVTQPFDGLVVDVAVAGSYAYVAARTAGLIVVDIADPAKPQQIGFYDTPGEAAGVTLADSYPGYAFVADLSGGLRVIDISRPTHPKETGFYDPADFATSSVAIQGGYAYVTAYLSGLHVLDLSDLTQPQLAGIYQPSTGVLSVAVADGYAYVGEEYYGLRVLDISDPANPLPVGLCQSLAFVFDLVVAGDYAYVSYLGTGLYLVQITDPANPTVVGWYPYLYNPLPLPVRDLALADGLIYLAVDIRLARGGRHRPGLAGDSRRL